MSVYTENKGIIVHQRHKEFNDTRLVGSAIPTTGIPNAERKAIVPAVSAGEGGGANLILF